MKSFLLLIWCLSCVSCATTSVVSKIPLSVYAEIAASRYDKPDGKKVFALAVASALALNFKKTSGIWPGSMSLVRQLADEKGFDEMLLSELDQLIVWPDKNGDWLVSDNLGQHRLFILNPDGTMFFTREAFLSVIGNKTAEPAKFDAGASSGYFLGKILQLIH